MLAGALAIALLSGLYLALTEGAAPAPGLRPAGALDYAVRHRLTEGHVLNSYNYGGYLISQHIPTFIDGRGVVFGALFKQFFALSPQRLEELTDRYQVTWTLFEAKAAINVYLQQSPRWKQVYTDDTATIFERIR